MVWYQTMGSHMRNQLISVLWAGSFHARPLTGHVHVTFQCNLIHLQCAGVVANCSLLTLRWGLCVCCFCPVDRRPSGPTPPSAGSKTLTEHDQDYWDAKRASDMTQQSLSIQSSLFWRMSSAWQRLWSYVIYEKLQKKQDTNIVKASCSWQLKANTFM